MEKTDVMTKEQYEKVETVLAEIQEEKKRIKDKNGTIEWERNTDLILEDSRPIMHERFLQELSFWIEMIATGLSGADRVAVNLRKEFGEQWYKKWGKLVQDAEQKQICVVGLAYEIIFGDAKVKDFMSQ